MLIDDTLGEMPPTPTEVISPRPGKAGRMEDSVEGPLPGPSDQSVTGAHRPPASPAPSPSAPAGGCSVGGWPGPWKGRTEDSLVAVPQPASPRLRGRRGLS